MPAAALAIRLLGPVELWRGDAVVPAGGPTQRAVLAMLALHAGEPVPVNTLADGIWGEGEEPAGGKGIQMHVSRLRRLLRLRGKNQPLQTVPGGYRLAPDGLTIDTIEFERALTGGRNLQATGDAQAAAETLTGALGLWRGPALMDVRDFPFAAHVAHRLDELRVDAAEQALAARLALGETQALVPELQALIAEHPYRERLHGLLMTALYRAGQQSAALDAYTSARSRLVLDLGIEPGPELQQLQQQILDQNPALATPPTAVAAAEPSPSVRPSQITRLPVAPPLFGREPLLTDLAKLATTERMLTLTGAGGSGKTVLAIALANRLAAEYPDGTAFVDLAAVLRTDEVLPALAAAMGISQQDRSLPKQLAQVFAEQRRLVVLDNCEHLLDAVPDLSPLVNATAGVFIATSRAPLRLRLERLVPVPPLPLPDAADDLAAEPAVALFMRAANNAGAVIDPNELADVAAVCRAVDGLPLAIELVAAQAVVESVGELAIGLDRRIPSLPSPFRDVPDRQRTMETAIGWSLERMDAQAQSVFRLLSVFAGSFTRHAATAVAQLPAFELLQQLEKLTASSLTVRQPTVNGRPRFRMLEPVRAVGRMQLEQSGALHAINNRMATHFAQLAARISPRGGGPVTPDALSELRADSANLSEALAHLSQWDPPLAVRLLENLSHFWGWTGQNDLALGWAERLTSVPSLTKLERALVLLVAAAAGYNRQDLGATAAVYQRALDLGRDLSDPWIIASAQASLAMIADDLNDVAAMTRAANEAVIEARKTTDANLLARALMSLAYAATGPNRWDAADRALRIARERGSPSTLWGVLLFRGILASTDARLEEAAAAFEECAAIAARFGGSERQAYALANLGNVMFQAGNIREADVLHRRSLRALFRSGSIWIFASLEALGETSAELGDWRRAMLLLGASDEMFHRWRGRSDAATGRSRAAMLERARVALGADAAKVLYEQGHTLEPRQAVAFALGFHHERVDS